MRHGDQHAIDVGRTCEGAHDDIQICLWHLHRYAYAVVAACLEAAGQARWNLHIYDRITNDREQPRLTAQIFKHSVLSPFVELSFRVRHQLREAKPMSLRKFNASGSRCVRALRSGLWR